ncbi:MAG TPA: lytic transglycosylase domain-containing protein [Stellaceae bacterium]
MAVCSAYAVAPGKAAEKLDARALPGLAPGKPVHVETVAFADPRRPAVRLVRGITGPASHEAARGMVEIISFGHGRPQRVTVVHGSATAPAEPVHMLEPARQTRVETVAFADPGKAPVTLLRGPSLGSLGLVVFGPDAGTVLDRIAFAVDGIESRHGADPGMWRPDPDGPQGPMQVSLKAAIDVGGGNRFDPHENRLLGKAYLAQLYRRYGNWSDALAAYNWGPTNLDQWIAGGRRAETLPLEVARYVERGLRDALFANARF